MFLKKTIKTLPISLVIILSFILSSNFAHAQNFFDELFGNFSDGGGKRTINFSKTYAPGSIIVSFSDRRLYFIDRRGTAISYPIAVPSDNKMWKGNLKVTSKKVNPSWTPTAEMRAENPKLPAFVPGGHPKNPMGKRALYLGSTLYRIHGTDAPWTIGSAVSKGCIRMHNDHVIELYPRVPVGTEVIITWKRFLG